MQCPRCGATSDGRFCPRCGAPAGAAESGPPPPVGWPCPRCGTLFLGNFCPRCGLSTAAWAPPPSAPSSGRAILTVLWTIAIVSFLVFAGLSFAGLVAAPAVVVPGIEAIQSGETENGALDFPANWTFDPWGTNATGQYLSSGGNSGGHLSMTLPGVGSEGYWFQAFSVAGSVPYEARITIDIQITGGIGEGRLIVAVDRTPGPPSAAGTVDSVSFLAPTAWTTLPRFVADAQMRDPGTYYLKVAFRTGSSTGIVTVGLDNVRLAWATDAAVFLYVPAPLPLVFFVSQDKGLFLSYYALLITATLVAGAYHAVRERVLTWRAFRAPISAIGSRLRSGSAWIAVGQAWMAVTFFQVTFIYLLIFAGFEPESPIQIGPSNVWVFLFELANAGVYEEIAFRVLLIGLPMAIGSAILRSMEVNRGGGRWNGPGSAGRHIAGALRYALGGTVRRTSGREALVAAWTLLFVSSALFGLAHAPGWGWWKVLPSFVAGLGFGYLFLRHGLGAAILAHFVNDYAFSLYYMGVGGIGMEALLSLIFLGLTIAGAGFFLWYALDAWWHLRDLVGRFRPAAIRIRPAAMSPGPFASVPNPPAPMAPVEPPGLAPSPQVGPPFVGAPAVARDSAQIPREYVPTYRAPPYGYPPVRFQCPSCGWVEARYDAGRFTCTRCGRSA